jgi:ankyrin repeat protein
MYAAGMGDTEVVERLIKRGVNVNAHDDEGVTPLMLAAQEGRIDTVKLLLRNGARPDRADVGGFRAVDYVNGRMPFPVRPQIIRLLQTRPTAWP